MPFPVHIRYPEIYRLSGNIVTPCWCITRTRMASFPALHSGFQCKPPFFVAVRKSFLPDPSGSGAVFSRNRKRQQETGAFPFLFRFLAKAARPCPAAAPAPVHPAKWTGMVKRQWFFILRQTFCRQGDSVPKKCQRTLWHFPFRQTFPKTGQSQEYSGNFFLYFSMQLAMTSSAHL